MPTLLRRWTFVHRNRPEGSGLTEDDSYINSCAASVFVAQHAANIVAEVRSKLDSDAEAMFASRAEQERELRIEAEEYQSFLRDEALAGRVDMDSILTDHTNLCSPVGRSDAAKALEKRCSRLQRQCAKIESRLQSVEHRGDENLPPSEARRLHRKQVRLQQRAQSFIAMSQSTPHLHISSATGGRHTPLRLHGVSLCSPDQRQQFALSDCSYRHNPIGDTGSSITLIGYGDYERMRSLCPSAIRRVSPLPSSTSSVAGVGSVNAVLFHVKFTLVLGGLPVTFHDVPVLSGFAGILLGNDLKDQGFANISFERNVDNDGFVTFRDEQLDAISEPIAFTHRHPPSSAESSTFSADAFSADILPLPSETSSSSSVLPEETRRHIESCVPIAFAPESTRVPAWSEKLIKCRIPAASVEGHTLAILPLDDSRVDSVGVLVCPALVTPEDGHVWVKVVNPSTRPVNIPLLQPIARFIVDPVIGGKDLEYTVDEIMEQIHIDP